MDYLLYLSIVKIIYSLSTWRCYSADANFDWTK